MGLVFRENATFPIIGNKDDGLYCSWRILLVGTVSVLATGCSSGSLLWISLAS